MKEYVIKEISALIERASTSELILLAGYMAGLKRVQEKNLSDTVFLSALPATREDQAHQLSDQQKSDIVNIAKMLQQAFETATESAELEALIKGTEQHETALEELLKKANINTNTNNEEE